MQPRVGNLLVEDPEEEEADEEGAPKYARTVREPFGMFWSPMVDSCHTYPGLHFASVAGSLHLMLTK